MASESASPDKWTSCTDCGFWQNADRMSGFCRRHAPTPIGQPYQVARWPETGPADGCGEGRGTAGAADPPPALQTCQTCAFWHRPGVGIDPAQRGDRLAAWWQQAGWCRRFAPRPGIEIGEHGFWRVTHATDHCFDGHPAQG